MAFQEILYQLHQTVTQFRTATATDRDAFCQLTKTNEALQAQLAEFQAQN